MYKELLTRSRAQLVEQVEAGEFDKLDGQRVVVRINGKEHQGYLCVNWKNGHHEIDFKSPEGNATLYSWDYNNLTLQVFESMRTIA